MVDFGSCAHNNNISLRQKDDLEALFFMMCLMIKGHLPWKQKQGHNMITSYAISKVKDLKGYFTFLDNDFMKIYKFIKELKIKEQLLSSDYSTIKSLMLEALYRH
jgi:hypothetical protein